jgi:hypothetical protein
MFLGLAMLNRRGRDCGTSGLDPCRRTAAGRAAIAPERELIRRISPGPFAGNETQRTVALGDQILDGSHKVEVDQFCGFLDRPYAFQPE